MPDAPQFYGVPVRGSSQHKWYRCVLAAACLLSHVTVAQISPGPLSAPHRRWDGPSGCVACHTVGAGSAQLKCLECHKDIASRIIARRGYHATILPPTSTSQDCVRCHSEHNGADFRIVRFDPTTFDHTKAGFALDGKHASLQCAKCHNVGKIAATEKPNLSAQDLNKTYLGLSRMCASCHEDKHQGRLGNDCQRCHNTSDWKVTGKFDHAKTRFPLTGAHIQVTCQKCHTMPDKSVKYAGLAFDQCSSCHSDPHRGFFKQSCQSCHTTAAWKTPSTTAKFDHSETPYPLLGRHAEVKCQSCHDRGDFTKVISFRACSDCHKDPHRGQFAKRPDGGKCESCHTVEGFKQVKFTAAQHQKLGFKLTGGHAAVVCGDCHKSPLPGVTASFHFQNLSCTTCHADPHRSQFAKRMAAAGNKGCDLCHTTKAWNEVSSFDHATTAFALTGAHRGVRCAECHRPPNLEMTLKNVNFSQAPKQCENCHEDPHASQFGHADKATRCAECHNSNKWRPSLFDHEKTLFPLQGAHKNVPCGQCHKQIQLIEGKKVLFYKPTPKQCTACHGANIPTEPAKS